MVDQLEFADCIVINKADLVKPAQIQKIQSFIRQLNPEADLLTSVRSKVDLTRVLNTHKFSFERSMMSAGWLKSLREVRSSGLRRSTLVTAADSLVPHT